MDILYIWSLITLWAVAINHWSLNQSTTTERVINHFYNTTSACSVSLSSGWHPRSVPNTGHVAWHIIISTINTTLDVLTESHQMANRYGDIWGHKAEKSWFPCQCMQRKRFSEKLESLDEERLENINSSSEVLLPSKVSHYCLLWWSISSNGLFNDGLFHLCMDTPNVVSCDGWQRAGSPQRHGSDIQSVPA